jgi:hypothetical protein
MNRELVIFLVATLLLGGVGIGAVAWWRATHEMTMPFVDEHPRPRAHAASHDYTHDPSSPCTCVDERRRNGWCRHHGYGWVGGIRIDSAVVHDAVDAHGHGVQPKAFRCEGCRSAYETDGLCRKSGVGFVGGLMFNSQLTYWLAVAEWREPEALTCTTCRANAATRGWCDACGLGLIGGFGFATRADFDAARLEYDHLREALKLLPKCELCAGAKFTGGTCPRCRIPYPRSG